jgi:hypothetical protein
MFRSESLRERALLRLIERQELVIARLTEQVMAMAGKPWEIPYEAPSLEPAQEFDFELPEMSVVDEVVDR